MQDPVYTYTISPSPLKQGKKGVITTNAPVGTVVTFDWDPAGEPTSGTVGEHGKITFTAPSNATSLIMSDPWGNTASAVVGP